MYTILDDEEVEQPRAKFFRALELVGALASAVTAPFGGMIANQASNLFSGVFIPSAGKALPDRWPGFKRNIVNNAMPDLLKIPANSVAGHKHLFFSKNKIDTLISDQGMFDVRYLDTYRGKFGNFRVEVPPMLELANLLYFPNAGILDWREIRDKPQSGAPATKVISLQFDNVDIPFEEVVEGAEGQARANLATLELDLEGQIKKLERIRSNSGQVIFDSISLFTKRLEELDKASEQLIAVTNLTSQGHRDFKNYLEAARSVVKVLQPPQDKNISDLEKDLLAGGDSTLENLRRDKVRLSSVSSQILSGGSQDTAAQSQLRAIADHVKQSERALEAYRTAAETVQRIGDYILENKSDLTNKVAQSDSNLRDSVIKLQKDFDDLMNKRTKLAEAQEGKLLLMNSLSWTDLQKLGNKVLGKMSLPMTIVGTGEVKSLPEGLFCATGNTGTCSKDFDYGIEVTISVNSGTLSSWEGVCSGSDACKVTMDDNKTVTARF